MDLLAVHALVPLLAALGYTLVLLHLLAGDSWRGSQTQWFLGFVAVSVLWELSPAVLSPVPPFTGLASQLLSAGTLFLGMTTATYVEWPYPRRWLLLGSIAIAAAFVLDLFFADVPARMPLVTNLELTVGSLASRLVWFTLNVIILVRTWVDFRRTRLPWHANRLLHWALFVFVVFLGEILHAFNEPVVSIFGQLIRFLGVVALARAITSHRLFDVRARLRKLIAFLLIVLASAIPAAALFLATRAITSSNAFQPRYTYVAALLIIIVGLLLYQPFRRWTERIVYRYLLGQEFQTSKVVRSYSQAISRTLDVEQLSLVILGTMSELLETTSGTLMLVSKNQNPRSPRYEIEPVPTIGQSVPESKSFHAGSRFIETLAQTHQPLLQYEIDFNPLFADLSQEQRHWLASQNMEVYVPVHAEDELAGLIALGPKRSRLAYRPNELELVQVLADQTVIALENARLYSALNQQHERIRHLNTDLREQNERLEILDRVKSDFITIASHELRTPLTQVKGYAEILASMNEEGSLTPEQTREILDHISRASERLAGLLSAMLDASQLEASGIQLTLSQTKIDAVIRLAVEPLEEALNKRRLSLHTAHLQEQPPLQADFRRLVQAFHNIIGNAVKYTPDHGSIRINAFRVAGANGHDDFLEVVVADTGIGIDPEYQELIFEKFFRVGNPELHSTGSTKFKGAGPGLGLHIAKGVIEAHGGRIWVESAGEDEERLPGSEFHVVLPVTPPGWERGLRALSQPLALRGEVRSTA